MYFQNSKPTYQEKNRFRQCFDAIIFDFLRATFAKDLGNVFFFSDQIYIGNKQCFTVEVSWSLRSNFLYYLTKQ
jgi:hypothetical protein